MKNAATGAGARGSSSGVGGIGIGPVTGTLGRLPAVVLGLALAASVVAPAAAQTLTGDPKMGGQRAAMCSGCHGIAGLRNAYPEVFHVPKIGNQHAEYIASALQAYRSGERTHPTMRSIAAGLSDQAIADLAAYYSRGGLRAPQTASK